ncbi:DUF4238 domain-containing protein [Microbacterium sp.]|uniref:DUF4238 domain-containing protein n=1 Tax=Microbacterium sp. TaxID=51671 RepID=UPI0037C8A737
MSSPKLHHYVPRFYLRRFADAEGRLWVWDRVVDRVYATSPSTIAAETKFYFHDELAEQGRDPLTMEAQFASLEGAVSGLTGRWLDWIRAHEPGDALGISTDDRDTVGLFVALQFLRSADTRETIARFASSDSAPEPTVEEARKLHLHALWDEDLVDSIASRLIDCTWVFAKNGSSTPLATSDNPVAFRTDDNRKWLRGAILSEGTYLVYPLAPDVIMYGYPTDGRYGTASIARFNNQISPVELTDGMASSENSAQVFMASRHVVSGQPDFAWAKDFARTTGTDLYAPPHS